MCENNRYGYKPCTNCNGTGTVSRVPYYATVMPDPIHVSCPECYGKGKVFIVPRNTRIITENIIDFKSAAFRDFAKLIIENTKSF